MAKDINIHVKTEGTQQVNRDLQEVTQGVNKVGENVEQMGSRSSRALEWFASGIRSLAGPLGFAAIIATVSHLAGKISSFFSDLQNHCDEAVAKLQNLRKGFEGIFEAMDAFDEKSRKQVFKENTELLRKTSVTPEIGLPVIEQYARQFRGKLAPEQYQQGLEGMLGYAARHGKMATPELITLMSGFGMTTPEQQGTFRRQIGAVSKASGLDEENIITALGRASPTATAMGWKPEEMLNYIGTIAAGEVGRKQITLPSTTLDALVNPQEGNLKNYRISPRQAQNPAQLLAVLAARRGNMSEQAFGRMLSDIYGNEAAAGISKLIKTPGGAMAGIIREAATPQAAAAETAEEMTSRQTMERIAAQTEAVKTGIQQDVTDAENYKQKIREIGAAEQDRLQIRRPFLEKLREMITPAFAKKKDAAFIRWLRNLSPEEKTRILNETTPPSFFGPIPLIDKTSQQIFQLKQYYQGLTPKQQFEGLGTEDANFMSNVGPSSIPQSGRITGSPVINNYNTEYHHDTVYYPIAGSAADRDIGPRAGRDFR
jgi:hypothetical protein